MVDRYFKRRLKYWKIETHITLCIYIFRKKKLKLKCFIIPQSRFIRIIKTLIWLILESKKWLNLD